MPKFSGNDKTIQRYRNTCALMPNLCKQLVDQCLSTCKDLDSCFKCLKETPKDQGSNLINGVTNPLR